MKDTNIKNFVKLVCKAVSLAMGVAVVALSILRRIDANSAIMMLGIGVICVGINSLTDTKEKQ